MIFLEEEKFKKSIGIYKIKNIENNKVYIGQTCQSFQKRFWHHQWKLKNGNHDNKFLQNEWNKYGEEKFEFSIIEIVDKSLLDEREIFWIEEYRKQNICLNLQDGGQSVHLERFVSPETRKRVGEINREKLTGKKLSEETKEKMSKARLNKSHIKKKTDSITEKQAREIKKLFVQGFSSHEIMEILNIPYKPINGILSADNWKSVKVDGWEEFKQNRPKGKGSRAQGKFDNKAKSKSKEEIDEILRCYSKYQNYSKVAKELNIGRATITKYVKMFYTSCQPCAKTPCE